MNIRSLPLNSIPRRGGSARRIGTLATLPVFYKLQGRKVLVAGGSEAAAWKAELLAAAGAEVHIYAETLHPVFSNLIAAPGASGVYKWHQRPWSADCFARMQVAICDAETDAEAAAFHCAARAAGVAVNVIDKPAYCDFQFGSIVNRSPVVISISTDGAAPILGQAIRRRIEALISPSVGKWAQFAQSTRGVINDILAPGPERRAFWEAFVDRAFGAEPGFRAADELVADATAIKASGTGSKGRVTYVSAGPGDPELLTLKAVRALQSADVILFDDRVSDEVMDLARREARRVPSGGRGDYQSSQQDETNATMIELVKHGKHVVYLKGGDPMNSACIGEEISRLHGEGIAVAFVPGVLATAAGTSLFETILTDLYHKQSDIHAMLPPPHGASGLLSASR